MGGSSSLSEVVSFFKSTGANTDVTPAINATAWLFKITTFIVSVIGFAGMALYVLRIGVDVLLIVGSGIKVIEDKFANLGTGKSGRYTSAWGYVQDNIPNIVFTMVLITFMITGWIFNLIAWAINGIGSFINWISGMDVVSTASNLVADAYKERIPSRDTSDLKKEYDTNKKEAQGYFRSLNEYKAPNNDDPKYQELKSMYTQSMAKAESLAKELRKRGADIDLKLGAGYFDSHLRQNDDGTSYCREAFLVEDIMQKYDAVKCK